MTRKQTARNRFNRENLIGNADGKQFARKHSDGQDSDGQDSDGKQSDTIGIALTPLERKAILALLPLKTHVDMVTLTLNNLDVKLGAIGVIGETQDTMRAAETMSTADVELLRRLSERLMQQRERIERMCGEVVVRGASVGRRMM